MQSFLADHEGKFYLSCRRHVMPSSCHAVAVTRCQAVAVRQSLSVKVVACCQEVIVTTVTLSVMSSWVKHVTTVTCQVVLSTKDAIMPSHTI